VEVGKASSKTGCFVLLHASGGVFAPVSQQLYFAEEVAKKQQEKEEESAAAAKIQARYRGKKAGKDFGSGAMWGSLGATISLPVISIVGVDHQEVQEMREQKGAATAIQARNRQRAAQREVNALRKEKQEPPTFHEKLGKVNGSS